VTERDPKKIPLAEPPLAEPPVETKDPVIRPPASHAGGFGALQHTTMHSIRHMGAVRGAKTLLRTNQIAGFDCPGCAWPEPQAHRSAFEFCENGAKAVASEATLRRADPDLFKAKSLRELSELSDRELNDLGRITHPMVLRPGATHYEPVSWEQAFAHIGAALAALPSPDAAAFYTSGRTSNEAAFLYQLFAREFGTNNLPDCSNMCHESSGAGMDATLGVGKGTVTLEDFALADAIFVVGQNPGTNHPRMLATLREARMRGAAIVSVNPMNEAGTQRFAHPQDPVDMLEGGKPIASMFLQVRINGDVALFQGIMKAMLEAERAQPGAVFDHAFIAEHTMGYESFVAALDAVPWSRLVQGAGISEAQMRAAARVAVESRRTIVCWAMGLTQHKNGVANVQQIVNFLLLRGNIGRPGAGACPVRGHSNVQGDRTMGIWEKMPAPFLDGLGAEFGFAPPRHHGVDVVDCIRHMDAGKITVFLAMGGNFLSAAPDTQATARALRRCDLTAHISTKLHRGHLVTGRTALILPCLGRTERDVQAKGPQFVTVENSMSIVSKSEGVLDPAADTLRSEVAIVCGVAQATLGNRSCVPWGELCQDYDAIRARIARVVPGCANYNARVREPGGFYLGNAAARREFRTPGGKAVFTVHALPEHNLAPGELLMMTIRSHDQYNTTVYGDDDRYRGVVGGRRVIFMNQRDLEAQGLAAGAHVDLVGVHNGQTRVAPRFMVVAYDLPQGCAATYFPEANVLVPLDSVADTSNTPASKSVVIRVRPAVG
jgi:molybdopterin-dependent oxidoreductase alpha subunit